MKYSIRYDSPVCALYIAEEGGAITDIAFEPVPGAEDKQTELTLRAVSMLREYFAGERRDFDLPLAPAGTPFQLKAWQALRAIPYGQTRTYAQQAAAIGNVRASRAVGAANGVNPIAVIVPCHRVIGADGSLTGYGGGLDRKATLLGLESGLKASR